ncbi:MAG: anti-sigma factor family protein [Acidobacteriota bacterium]
MNCSRLETLLTDYMEGLLEEPVRLAVAEHLESCAGCGSLHAEVGRLREQLQDFPLLTPPVDLVGRILARTSGKPPKRSFWSDLIVPTLRPFMTQRFGLATVMLFVFLSLMVNLVGPPAGAVLSPASLVEGADRVSSQISKGWAQVQYYKTRLVEEFKLLQEDLTGRIDYHLVTLLFKSYQESLEESQESEQAGQVQEEPEEPEP